MADLINQIDQTITEIIQAKSVIANVITNKNIALVLPALGDCGKAITDAISVIGEIAKEPDLTNIYNALTGKNYLGVAIDLFHAEQKFVPAALSIYRFITSKPA